MVVRLFSVLFILVGITAGSVLSSEWDSRTLQGEPKDVVDYFLRLPRCWYDEYRDTLNIFEVRKTYLVPNEFREVTVDIGNGYLQIRDNLNELEERLTLTYFKRENGPNVIGFSEYYMGGDCDYYDVNFYEYVDHAWRNVTDLVLPELEFLDFWDADTTFPIEQYLVLDDNIHWNYVLPQRGTTVTVFVEPLEALICFEMLESISFENEDEFNMVMNEYFSTVRNRTYDAIELKWNRQDGVFEIAE